ncbi:MAG: DUF72 domain-containing protein [Chthoniobacterales bacterium]|nr:DUF72 domain-containing protein [Chthoniobacterales bacterium]MBA3762840.1 DUF72 domain-containing protein [Chthoniobacterales bacterium]
MRKTRNSAGERTGAAPGLAATQEARWPETRLRIGISGWTYPPWRGVFYPKTLGQRDELRYASRQHNTIEINGSFYSLQMPSSYERWYAETPANFIFSVKGARFITHMKKLRDIETPLANFFGSGLLALREKLGPILWQFPPNFGWNEERFRSFFNLLPQNTAEAAELTNLHDEKLKYGVWSNLDVARPIRYAVEIRHPTFLVPEFFALLREYNIAFVFADTAGKWPYAEDFTANFVYIRLHGAEQLYVSGYSDPELDWWRARIDSWRRGRQPGDRRLRAAMKPSVERDVYAYFDNDAKVHAPFDAMKLATRLGMQPLVLS